MAPHVSPDPAVSAGTGDNGQAPALRPTRTGVPCWVAQGHRRAQRRRNGPRLVQNSVVSTLLVGFEEPTAGHLFRDAPDRSESMNPDSWPRRPRPETTGPHY